MKKKKKTLAEETKKAVKNSVYTYLSNGVAKAGGLLYIFVLARLLTPELFGLYSLTFSTLMIIVTLTNFGVFHAFVVHVSKEHGRGKLGKAKAYFLYLTKFKFVLLFLAVLFILFFSRLIAEGFYGKPIFLGLLAGAFYVVLLGIVGIMKRAFQSINRFKESFYQETIFQVARLVIVPILVIYALRYSLSKDLIIFVVILGIAFSILASILYLLPKLKHLSFLETKETPALSRLEKKRLHQFLFAVSATAITGSFFSYIDTLMLGRYVLAEYLGYYAAAFSLASAAATLITFSAALMPVFSEMPKKLAEKFYLKSAGIMMLISIAAFIFTFFFASPVVHIVFGAEYATAVPLLKLFSILLLVLPVTSVTSTYLISLERPGIVTLSKLLSTILNVALNITLITWLVSYGPLQALYGAATATIISNTVNLLLMLFLKKVRL